MTKKQEIGQEVIRWLPHDRAYVTTLVAYAKGEGLLTDSEAIEAKAEIDAFYKGDDTVKSNRARYMGAVLSRIGFQKTKILWRLIDQLPRRLAKGIECPEFVPNHDAIVKGLKIPSLDYYKVLDDLIDLGYIYRQKEGKKMIYGIDFQQIMAEGNERGVTL